MIRDPWLRALLMISSLIAAIYLVGLTWQVVQQFADILLLFFMAWLLAFILEPVVWRLTVKSRVPRLLAIMLTYATMLVVLTLGIILLVPALTAQLVQMVGSLPDYAERVSAWLLAAQAGANEWLVARHSPLQIDVGSALNPEDLSRRIEAIGPPLLQNVVQWATSAATLLFQVIVVLILSFYFMVDGARIGEGLITALPESVQGDARFLLASVHRAFAGFLRGQLIQAIVSGIGTGLIMATLGVQYALLTSFIAGAILLIPFVGPVVAVWLPVMIALFTRPDVAWILLIALLALQQVIFNVLAPRIMSQQVGLHPLMVFLAVLLGARLAGIWGAVFGVPVVAVLTTMASFYHARQRERTAQRDADTSARFTSGPAEPPAGSPVVSPGSPPSALVRKEALDR